MHLHEKKNSLTQCTLQLVEEKLFRNLSMGSLYANWQKNCRPEHWLVVLSAKLLEEYYYDFVTQGHRLILFSNNFGPSAVDLYLKSSKSKLLYLVLYFMSHKPMMGFSSILSLIVDSSEVIHFTIFKPNSRAVYKFSDHFGFQTLLWLHSISVEGFKNATCETKCYMQK